MFMKTFEEKWTAWLDGELTGKELAEFEASLPDKAAAELEKQDALKLGAFLKEQLRAPAMRNAEFFNHQLRQQIESESAPAVRPVESRAARDVVVDQSAALDGRHLARDFRRLHVLRHAGKAEQRAIDLSDADHQRARRSRRSVRMRRSRCSNRRKTKRRCCGWTACSRCRRSTRPSNRSCATSFLLLQRDSLAADLWHDGVARDAETVWSGLVMANNVPEPTPIPAELSGSKATLKQLFGYNQFQVIGQSRKTLKTGSEEWLAASKYFSLHVDSKAQTRLRLPAQSAALPGAEASPRNGSQAKQNAARS